jgi:putative membrane protein
MTDAAEPPRRAGNTRTQLAYERTRIAADRTLMAWTRTAVSLIGFGFGIPKFFRYLAETAGVERPLGGPVGLGLALIALGALSLVAGMIQHTALLRRIAATAAGTGGAPRSVWSPSLATAACLLLFGLFAFLHVLLRR